MCERCLRRLKRLGYPKGSYGHIKAIALRFIKPWHIRPTKRGGWYLDGVAKLHADSRIDLGVEAHLFRIQRAKTKRKYSRKNLKLEA